jgi:hypothetical protein
MRNKLAIGGLAVTVGFLLATNPVVVNAAGQITGAQIKNNTIKGKDIKDNSVTGKDVLESSLGTVPSATTATNATNSTNSTNSTNAQNANTTGQITSFTYAANAGDTGTVILNNFHGLTLTGDCAAGGMTLRATSSQAGAVVSEGALVRNDNTLAGNNAQQGVGATPVVLTSPAGTVDTGNGSGTGFSIGQIVYVVPGTGTRVSVDWAYTGNFGFASTCAFYGTATGTTGGPAQVSRGTSGAPAKPAGGSAVGR